jgi:hypothetical protein
MKKTIYFPNFEPPNKAWLKFALLYMENFSPIIPKSGLGDVSEEFARIINNTDLVTPYNPDYNEGTSASIKSIEFLERIFKDEYRYGHLFNKINLRRDMLNSNRKNHIIYREKYSWQFQDFCIQNELGIETENGIFVTEELGIIYMSYLAEEIAYRNSMSVISDNTKFDNFLNHRQLEEKTNRAKQEFAKGVISLIIPKNISQISIPKLIEFRNKNIDKIKSFNRELNNSIQSIENGITHRDFINNYNSAFTNLNAEIINLSTGILAIPLTTYILMNNDITTTTEYIKEIVELIGMIAIGKTATNSIWKKIYEKNNCKRYFTNLNQLNKSYA